MKGKLKTGASFPLIHIICRSLWEWADHEISGPMALLDAAIREPGTGRRLLRSGLMDSMHIRPGDYPLEPPNNRVFILPDVHVLSRYWYYSPGISSLTRYNQCIIEIFQTGYASSLLTILEFGFLLCGDIRPDLFHDIFVDAFYHHQIVDC